MKNESGNKNKTIQSVKTTFKPSVQNLVSSKCKLKNIVCSTWLKTSSKIMRGKGLKTYLKIMKSTVKNRKLLNLLAC